MKVNIALSLRKHFLPIRNWNPPNTDRIIRFCESDRFLSERRLNFSGSTQMGGIEARSFEYRHGYVWGCHKSFASPGYVAISLWGASVLASKVFPLLPKPIMKTGFFSLFAKYSGAIFPRYLEIFLAFTWFLNIFLCVTVQCESNPDQNRWIGVLITSKTLKNKDDGGFQVWSPNPVLGFGTTTIRPASKLREIPSVDLQAFIQMSTWS